MRKPFLNLAILSCVFLNALADDSIPVPDSVLYKNPVAFNSIIEIGINDELEIHNVTVLVNEYDKLSHLKDDVRAVSSSVSKLKSEIFLTDKESINVFQTGQIMRELEQTAQKLKKVSSDLKQVTANLYGRREKILHMKYKWIATHQQLDTSAVFNPVRSKVESIISSLNDLIVKLDAVLKPALDMQSSVASHSVWTQNEILELSDRINEAKNAKIFFTSAPLWGSDVNDGGELNILQQWEKSFQDEWILLTKFTIEFRNDIFIQALILALFYIIFYFLHRYIRKTTFEERWSNSIRKIEHIYDYPLSVALILTAYFTLFIYTGPPVFFNLIILTLLLVGMIRPIWSLFKRTGAKYMMYFTVLIFLSRLLYFTFSPVLSVRLYMIALSISGAAICYHLLFIKKYYKLHNKYLGILIRTLITFTFCAFCLSVITNVAGMTDISMKLLYIPLILIFSVVLFYISINIYKGVVVLIMSSKGISSIHIFQKNRESISNFSVALINIVFFYMITINFLRIFGLSDYIWSVISNFLNEARSIGSFDFTYKSVFLFIFIVYISMLLGKVIKHIIEDGVLFYLNFKKGTILSLGSLMRYIIITGGFLIAVSAMGIDANRLTVLMGALGVGIGFGLQNIFNNILSGLILIFDRTVQIGDTVELGNLLGKVKNIGLRSSSIRTYDGAEVLVPNGHLVSNEVTNWTLSDQLRRIELIVGVAYGTDLLKAKEIISRTIENNREILRIPKPFVLLNKLGESSLDLRILFWTDNYDDWVRIKGEVLLQIYTEIQKAGIVIPFPQRDVHIITEKHQQDTSGSES